MADRIIAWIRKNWRVIVVAVLCFIFFIGTASFNYQTQSYGNGADPDFVKWASPDENANYVFSKLYAQENKLTFFEKNNLYAQDIIHPRSFRSDNGTIKPMSFLGLILIYGKIAALTSYKVIPYLTPIFGALGIFYFFLLIRRIFGEESAFISAILAACFPPLIYFSARSLFHNVLFISLLITGLYYALSMCETRSRAKQGIFAGLAGLLIGLAVITRTSELIWLLPLLLALWLLNIKRIGVFKLVIFSCFFILALLPMLFWNQVLYDSPFLGGYPDMNRSLVTIKDSGSTLVSAAGSGLFDSSGEIAEKIWNEIFHFGFDAYQSGKMLYYYLVEMFSWLFILSASGIVVFAIKWWRWRYRHLVYFVGLALTAIILVFYYGSWEFYDNPDKTSHTLGNSYTRYWLPVYLGLIPYASYLIWRWINNLSLLAKPISRIDGQENFFSHRAHANYFKIFISILLISPILLYSVNFTIFGSAEGLYYLAQRQIDSRAEWEKIRGLTEGNSVLITQYHDKLFFPERKVIVGLFDDPNMITEYADIAANLPVYYYNFTFPEKALNFLNNNRLLLSGLQIEMVAPITKDFTLYKLSLIASNVKTNDDQRNTKLDN